MFFTTCVYVIFFFRYMDDAEVVEAFLSLRWDDWHVWCEESVRDSLYIGVCVCGEECVLVYGV